MIRRLMKHKFTLIEITVAFGILAIMVMFLMQLLSTAQKAGTFAEKRARAYADSRVAFDFIEKILKNADSISVPSNSQISVTAVKPFDDKNYEIDMKIELDPGNNVAKGVLKFAGADMIYNVHSFGCVELIPNSSYLVRLVIFGSADDYKTYEDEVSDGNSSYSEDEKKFLAEHSFTFIRIINLQR